MNILSIRTSTFGSAHPFVLIAAVAAVSLLSGCAGRTAHAMDSPGATKVRAKVQESAGGGRAAAKLPRVPPPEASAAKVAAGYKVEVVVKDLNYPTSVEFDERGNMFVAEAGYGDEAAQPRILRVSPQGQIQVLRASQYLNGPVNDLLWHDGRLYISHRGKISVLEGEKVRDLVTGLPSDGDHQNNQMTVGPDGKIYFGQGTASNSGVVGEDSYKMGWLKKHPEFHDVPAKDIQLRGKQFTTKNPLTEAQDDRANTAAFHPFGDVAPATGSTVGDERQAHPYSQYGRHLARDARWSIARKPASREFVRTGHRTASAAAVK